MWAHHTPKCGCGFRQDAGAGFDAGQGPTASFLAQLEKCTFMAHQRRFRQKQGDKQIGHRP